MDGLAVWHSKEQYTTMKVPHGADQILLIPLTGEVSVMTLGSTGQPQEVRLSDQATLLSRKADTDELRLKGESAVLVMYRLKQPKSVENLQKAKRAGLYPHIPTATQQEKKGIPKATCTGPMGIADTERWRNRQGQEEDPDLAPYLYVLEQDEHTLRRKFERSLAGSDLVILIRPFLQFIQLFIFGPFLL